MYCKKTFESVPLFFDQSSIEKMIRAAAVLKRSATSVVHKNLLHSSRVVNAGSVFRMPAMSPTMTEGGIVNWKYKAGEEFSSGEVLLEVETDKATIDVEAIDDGIMWEILINDGATGIPVGEPIAYLAEPGDDLASLEKPKPDVKEEPKPKTEEPKEEPKQESAPKHAETFQGESVIGKANPKQTLFPSVELLLHENGISFEDAIANIQATGPKGRLLKGDILAHLGLIKKESVEKLAQQLKAREHLDLSNIQLATPEESKKLQQIEEKPVEKSAPAEPVKSANILNVKVSSVLSADISHAKFQHSFSKSIQSAIRQTYAQKFPQYASSPSATSDFASDIFGELTSPSVTANRFEVYNIKYKFASAAPAAVAADAFDSLLGLSAPAPAPTSLASESVSVEFNIKFDTKLSDSKQFVEDFEDSLLSQIPANQLIITQ